ncbi:amino acid adenylation domain-containing protein [Dokdonia ponticola]|uniref:Amino acid adenylation domain-containing protein n=1 Tax=Dokdonia ponticola TaxID=2041041 RepID=A0ABV9HUM7_9FLAO
MLDAQKIQKKESIQKTNDTAATTICELIAKQMQAHPKRMAIIDGHTEIHYEDLRQRVHEVAGELKHRGIQPGSLVGVCMHRSWELVATLLGVMQAGCAYVPLDPAYPHDRIRYMLENSRAVAAIVDIEHTAHLCKDVREVIRMNDIGAHTDATVHPTASDLAYVIYTSGSTGQPKGVAIAHRGMVAMRQSMLGLFSDEELKGVLAAASVCFDTSVMEIMGTLSLGGTIILAKNALELTKLPAVDQLRTCVMVASAMQAILAVDKLPRNLQCLVFGGEALKHSLVQQVFAQNPSIRVFNAYGPTEDTVYSTIAELYPDTELVTIGKSVPNSRAYILDPNLQPVLNGESGELHLAGNKLARGYLYDEALTKKRFIENTPSDQIPDHRLYKTGDLCRWTDEGNIEFLGRIDQQVKIRGFRIELEEIESTLETMDGIDAAAAAVIEGGMGQKILVVYVVSQDTTITAQQMKAYMAERLPSYMVPQVIKYLAALPLLPNDKLDRKKLQTLEAEIRLEQEASITSLGTNQTNPSQDLIQRLRGSQNEQQATILAIIQNELAALLHFGDPSEAEADHSFNGLGLDSLSTLEFSRRLSNIIGQEVPDQAVFKHATPNALANYITRMMGNGADTSTTSELKSVATDSLAGFQKHMQSSHPTFQAAKVNAWSVNDKSKLVQEVLRMVNDNRRNPYSKVLRSGSGTRGLVGDAYNDEEQESIIWTTNLYLGLNRDPTVMAEATDALQRYGTGMGTSAAASGMTNQHLEFETEFADLVGKPSACLFPTGYTANVGAIAGILGKNDVVIIDQLCHASIVDGARLCGASIRTFQHNNAADLEAVLKSEVSPYHTVMVVLEGVYSMGEGAAPVADIVRMAKKYGALVLVDEAHSFGFYGKGGAGICAAQGVTEEVDFIMTTLSKAMGSLGGVVAASQQHVDLMKSASRAYIFQASVSPADMAAALTALRRLRVDDALRERLWTTTRYMRQQFEEAGYNLGTGDGPIVTPHFADKDKLYAIVQHLYKKGIQTSAVTYPIVEMGRGRLRLICSAAHTKEDVDKTLKALIEAEQEVDIQLAKKQHKTTDTNIKSTDLKDWAQLFATYLQKSVAKSTVLTPNLAIVIQVLEESVPIIFLIKDRTVTLTTHTEEALPTCSLLLTDPTAVTALQTGDVQAILSSICDGSCTLKGQIEAFVWFVARMVERG